MGRCHQGGGATKQDDIFNLRDDIIVGSRRLGSRAGKQDFFLILWAADQVGKSRREDGCGRNSGILVPRVVDTFSKKPEAQQKAHRTPGIPLSQRA